MQQLDKITIYINSVCEQIRWKKAHTILSDELRNHIIDQKNAFIASGLEEESATDKAICEMGDPVIVGTQFDHTHRPKAEWSMIFLTIFSLFVGMIINFFVKSGLPNTPELYYLYSSIVVGIACMIIAYFLDFTIIGKHPKIIFALLTVALIVLCTFSIDINGTRRWLSISILGTFYTSSFMLLFPTAYAGIIYAFRNKGYLGIILCGVFYAIPTFIFLKMSYGITVILLYTLSCLTLLAVSIFKGWFNVKRLYGLLVVFVLVVTIFAVFLLTAKPYQVERFTTWLSPLSDPFGRGYVTTVTRDILSGAKFFGQGLLADTSPIHYTGDVSLYLPAFNTDYVITYLIHRIGWVAFIAISSVLTAFIARGFYLCSKQKSILGRLVSTSVLLTFTMQVLIYITANLGFQPFSQLTLPLISYGGVSTIINLILIGIMLSVFKSGYLMHDTQKMTSDFKNKQNKVTRMEFHNNHFIKSQ